MIAHTPSARVSRRTSNIRWRLEGASRGRAACQLEFGELGIETESESSKQASRPQALQSLHPQSSRILPGINLGDDGIVLVLDVIRAQLPKNETNWLLSDYLSLLPALLLYASWYGYPMLNRIETRVRVSGTDGPMSPRRFPPMVAVRHHGSWGMTRRLVLSRKSTFFPPARLAVLARTGMGWMWAIRNKPLWPWSLLSTRPLEGGEHIAYFVPLISIHWLLSVVGCMGLPRSSAAHLGLGLSIFPLGSREHHPLTVYWPPDCIFAAAGVTRLVQVFSAHDAAGNAEAVSFAPGGMLRVSPKVDSQQMRSRSR